MKLTLRFLLLLASVAGSLSAANDPAEAVQRFKESLKSVDRLVVERTEWEKPKNGEQGKVVLEIKGTEVIATLGDTLEIEKFDMECLCLESPKMDFYSGGSYRFSMTLHHSQNLRGRDAVLGGEAVLTEASAARFRDWFAEHGFDGFVKRYEEMQKAIAGDKARQERFLEIFPEAVRGYFPSKDEEYDLKVQKQKRAKILAHYQNRTDLILDCWRGLGDRPISYSDGSWERRYEDFLRDLLATLEVRELHLAFAALPADEDRVWIGACRYSRYPGSRREEGMAEVFTDEWLARLAKRILPLVQVDEQEWILKKLAEQSSAATSRLLLEIAESDPLALMRVKDGEERFSGPRMSIGLQAILALAKNRVADCRSIILRRLPAITDLEVRLVLEVAVAQFDGPAAIGIAHLQCQIADVAELAWQTATKDSSVQISMETLAGLATQSKSYRVRAGAETALEKFGLRVLGKEAKAEAILAEPQFKKAKTMEEIELVLSRYEQTFASRKADEVERRVLAVLKHRKGVLLLQAGEYEQAAPLLIGGSADRNLYADQAFALQALGRFNDASNSLGRSVETRDEEAVTARLVRSGYLAFAQGHFEYASANFAAAKTISVYLRDQGPVTLIQYLSDLLAGKQPEVPSSEHISITDSGFEGFEDSFFEDYWPEIGSQFLHGKLTEAEIFARIEKQKGEKEKDLCEAHFVFSGLCRAKGDSVGEIKHLQSALETKAFTNQCYSLATVRFRDLATVKK